MTQEAVFEDVDSDVTKMLDMESNAILMELQDALDAVALDEESIRSIRSRRTNHDGVDHDDPASQEHELSMLMDCLVDELRADLQTQMATEDFLVPKQNSPADGILNNGPLVPHPPSTEESLNAVSTHSAQSTASFDVPEVLADFTKEAIEGLSPAQKDLLQRLRHHLHQKHNNENPDEDRVYQEIPDFLETSTDQDVRFEKVEIAASGDDDFVPVADFSKKSLSKRQLKPLKTQLPTEEEALELAEAMALAVRYHPKKSQDDIRRLVFSQKEFQHLDPKTAIKDHTRKAGGGAGPPSTRRVPPKRGMPQRAPSFKDRIQNFFKNRNNNNNHNTPITNAAIHTGEDSNNESNNAAAAEDKKKLPHNSNHTATQQTNDVFDRMERGNVWKRISKLVFREGGGAPAPAPEKGDTTPPAMDEEEF